jgi:hypothetical protein
MWFLRLVSSKDFGKGVVLLHRESLSQTFSQPGCLHIVEPMKDPMT